MSWKDGFQERFEKKRAELRAQVDQAKAGPDRDTLEGKHEDSGKPWLAGLTDEGICGAYLQILGVWTQDKADQDLQRRLRLLEAEIDRRDLWDSPHLPPGRPALIDEALALALYGRD